MEKYLRAAELKSYRDCSDRSLPKRGLKSFTTTGESSEQAELQQSLDEHRKLLSEEKVERLNCLLQGEWLPDLLMVQVAKNVGKHLLHMGQIISGKAVLYPEEALYLMDTNCLEVYSNGIPLSMQEAYGLFLAAPLALEKYQVYAHLSRLGYTVVRHQGLLKKISPVAKTATPSVTESAVVSVTSRDILEDSSGHPDLVPEACLLVKCPDIVSPDVHGKEKTVTLPSPNVRLLPKNMTVKKTFGAFRLKKAYSARRVSGQDKGVPYWRRFLAKGCRSQYRIVSRHSKKRRVRCRDTQNVTRQARNKDTGNLPVKLCHASDCRPTLQRQGDDRVSESYSVNREVDTSAGGRQWYSQWDCLSLDASPGSPPPSHSYVPFVTVRSKRKRAGGEPGSKRTRYCNPQSASSGSEELKGESRSTDDSFRDDCTAIVDAGAESSASTTGASSWRQLKDELNRNVLPEAVRLLCARAVCPLVRLDNAKSTASVLDKLSIIEQVRNSHFPPCLHLLSIAFDVYLPHTEFKKTAPTLPNHRVVVNRLHDPLPAFSVIAQSMNYLADGVNLHFAVVDNGEVAFYSFNDVCLPKQVSIG